MRGGDTAFSGKPPSVLSERSFRLYFASRSISVLGDNMVPLALAFAVLELNGSPTALGLIFAARMAGLVSFVLVGGVVADRGRRRAVMMGADLVRLASQGTIAALLLVGEASLMTLAITAFVTGAGTGFFSPAATGMLPSIVAPDRLQQANGLNATSLGIGEVAGPLLASLIVVSLSPGWAFAVDAVSFGVSAILLSGLRSIPSDNERPHKSFLSELRRGWAGFRSRRWVWTGVVSIALGSMLWQAWNVLGPIIAEKDLGGAAAWGFAQAAVGAGAVAGGLIATRLRPERPLAIAITAYSLIPLGMLSLYLGLPLAPVLIAAALSGICLMLGNSLWETTLQRRIPQQELSRISAYEWLGSTAFIPIGLAIWGPAGDALGLAAALFVASVLQFLSAIALLTVEEIRSYRERPSGASR
jgi:MFS family permease